LKYKRTSFCLLMFWQSGFKHSSNLGTPYYMQQKVIYVLLCAQIRIAIILLLHKRRRICPSSFCPRARFQKRSSEESACACSHLRLRGCPAGLKPRSDCPGRRRCPRLRTTTTDPCNCAECRPSNSSNCTSNHLICF